MQDSGRRADPHPPLTGGKIGVLVAEDEALLRADTVRILTDAGMTAIEAVDADEAIAILTERDDIRVLITDIIMPAGAVNGYQLAKMVAARWPHVGLLLVSGADRPGPMDLPQGARFLSKPYRGQDLVSAVFAFVSEQTGSI